MDRAKAWGGMTEADIEAAIGAPAGEAVRIIRKYDPLFGREIGNANRYKVSICRTTALLERAEVVVEADSPEKAREAVKLMDMNAFRWREVDTDVEYETEGVRQCPFTKP